MRLLVVEDDLKIAGYLSQGLGHAGFDVDVAHDGESGYSLAAKGNYDLLVLDLMLPKLDGMTVLGKLRSKGIASKVLILSAKRSVDERIEGLQNGGDDYLTKPFSFGELVARCEALLRRPGRPTEATRLTLGDVSLDRLTREVWRDGELVALQAKEFALLELLMSQSGTVLTKSQILEKVWSYNFDPQTNVVDVLVCRLRNKLDRGHSAKTLHTIRGVGYVFKPA